jgi:hypothetical protein
MGRVVRGFERRAGSRGISDSETPLFPEIATGARLPAGITQTLPVQAENNPYIVKIGIDDIINTVPTSASL